MIIGFAGQGESGKSTAASYLMFQYDFTIFNFADPLKIAAAALIGEDVELYHDHVTKGETIDWLGITRRRLMQTLGTECIRNQISNDFWTLRMQNDIEQEDNHLIAIGDVRFANEAQMIKNMGGIIVLLEREGGFANDHPSEDIDFKCDYKIDNNGDMAELYLAINQILQTVEE